MSVDKGDLKKGMILEVIEETSVWYSDGTSTWLQPGDEVVVTSWKKRPGYINVQRAVNNWSDRSVLTVPQSVLRKPSRMLGEQPADGIDSHDPRVRWIFEDAARLADRLGLCEDYDRVCKQLGFPGRERDITIRGKEVGGVRMTATVRARSEREARGILGNMAGQAMQSIVQPDGILGIEGAAR